MLINEFTVYELKQIIKPVVQLQSMQRVISEIGEIIGIPKATREKIQKQTQFLLRYKGFDVFFSDLRWLRGRGPSIHLQFKRPTTKLQALLKNFFPESHRLKDMVCGEVIQDLKSICLEDMQDIKWTSTDINAHGWPDGEVHFRVTYPSGAFNDDWKQGYDISPLMISDEYHSDKWFISFSFNPGAFIRGEKTILRENWRENANDISKSIDAWVARNHRPDGPRSKSFAEWSEDMILDFGDEIVPKLQTMWETIHAAKMLP
jgi:hypothetical protein